MMKRQEIMVLCAAAVLGLAGGLLYGATRGEEGDMRKLKEISFRAAREEPPKGTDVRSYENLTRRVEKGGMMPKSGMDFLSTASRDEIFREMELLAASYRSRNDWLVNRRVIESLEAAARELYRREGIGAVEWAEKSGASMYVLRALVVELCRENPSVAGTHRKIFFERFGIGMGTDFHRAEIEGAASRSASELLALEKSGYSADGRYGEDFDFGDYISKSKSSAGIVSAMEYWAASDPGAAAEALRKGDGKDEDGWRYYGALKGRAAIVGETEAVEWIVGAMEGLDEDAWRESLSIVVGKDPSGSRVAAFLKSLPDEKRQLDFAAAVVGSYQKNGNAREYLSANYQDDFRIKIAEAWLDNPRHRRLIGMNELADQMMDDLKIPEAKREELRAGRFKK